MPRTRKRLLLKLAAYGLVLLLFLAAAAITFTVGWRPVVGAKARAVDPARRFEPTAARLARGAYLVKGVVGCYECHTKTDATKTPPARVAPDGSGALFIDDGGLRVVAPNITPDPATGIGAWSDDAVARAMREGIGHDGRALFPAMPYASFRVMSDEDLASVVAYLRTNAPAPAVATSAETRVPFPLSRLINAMPEPISAPVPQPDASTPERRGAYLATIGGCAECHTPVRHGEPIVALAFAGGNTTEGGERAASANLTPDPSGISYYDASLFVEAIRTGHVKGRALSNAMPWYYYRNMADDDLKSIFAYLRTLKPVRHRVDNTEPPTYCKLCGARHGLGDRN